MSRIVISANDQMSPDLARLAQALRDRRPALKRIEREVFRPLADAARAKAPFKTGELRGAIQPWSGTKPKARQAGVSVKVKHGLAIPKAALLLRGAKKHKYKKRDTYKVRSKKGNEFDRKNVGSPWGRVRKRPFFPGKQELMAQTSRIELILAEFFARAAGGQ